MNKPILSLQALRRLKQAMAVALLSMFALPSVAQYTDRTFDGDRTQYLSKDGRKILPKTILKFEVNENSYVIDPEADDPDLYGNSYNNTAANTKAGFPEGSFMQGVASRVTNAMTGYFNYNGRLWYSLTPGGAKTYVRFTVYRGSSTGGPWTVEPDELSYFPSGATVGLDLPVIYDKDSGEAYEAHFTYQVCNYLYIERNSKASSIKNQLENSDAVVVKAPAMLTVDCEININQLVVEGGNEWTNGHNNNGVEKEYGVSAGVYVNESGTLNVTKDSWFLGPQTGGNRQIGWLINRGSYNSNRSHFTRLYDLDLVSKKMEDFGYFEQEPELLDEMFEKKEGGTRNQNSYLGWYNISIPTKSLSDVGLFSSRPIVWDEIESIYGFNYIFTVSITDDEIIKPNDPKVGQLSSDPSSVNYNAKQYIFYENFANRRTKQNIAIHFTNKDINDKGSYKYQNIADQGKVVAIDEEGNTWLGYECNVYVQNPYQAPLDWRGLVEGNSDYQEYGNVNFQNNFGRSYSTYNIKTGLTTFDGPMQYGYLQPHSGAAFLSTVFEYNAENDAYSGKIDVEVSKDNLLPYKQVRNTYYNANSSLSDTVPYVRFYVDDVDSPNGEGNRNVFVVYFLTQDKYNELGIGDNVYHNYDGFNKFDPKYEAILPYGRTYASYDVSSPYIGALTDDEDGVDKSRSSYFNLTRDDDGDNFPTVIKAAVYDPNATLSYEVDNCDVQIYYAKGQKRIKYGILDYGHIKSHGISLKLGNLRLNSPEGDVLEDIFDLTTNADNETKKYEALCPNRNHYRVHLDNIEITPVTPTDDDVEEPDPEELDDYSIKIDFYDGETLLQSAQWPYNSIPEFEGEPTRESTEQYDYVFDGWNEEIQPATSYVRYYANFKSVLRNYIVSWVDYNGETIDAKQYEYGQTPEFEGAVPSRQSTDEYSYEFIGWDPEYSDVVSDVTYTAQYQQIPVGYPVVWYLNYDAQDDVYQTDETGFGADINAPAVNPSRAGYTFEGWAADPNSDVAIEDFSSVPVGGAEFYAVWNPIRYTITFAKQPEESVTGEMLAISAVYDENIKLSTNAYQYVGHTFLGWTDEPYSNTVKYADGDEVLNLAENQDDIVTLYPVWADKIYTIKIVFDGIENIEPIEKTAGIGAAIQVTLGDFEHYTFEGWAYDEDAQITIDDETSSNTYITVTGGDEDEIIITAKYAPIIYTVVFDDLEATHQFSGVYGSAIDFGAPDFDYYNFGYWHIENGDIEIDDIESQSTTFTIRGSCKVTAIYSPIVYDITYNLDGGENSIANKTSYTVEDEFAIVAPQAREGYKFLGWTGTDLDEPTVEFTIPSGSFGAREYTANWEATTETYTVTWLNYDQSQLATEEYVYGAIPRYEGKTPSREATESTTYEFAGWEPEIAPVTENVTYIAKYNEQSTVEPEVEYTVSVIGGTPEIITAKEGEQFVITANVAENGFEFVEWQITEGQARIGEVDNSSTNLTVVANAVVTATYAPIAYEITYNLDGGVNNRANPSTYTIEDEVEFAAPSREGYKFLGWFINETEVTKIDAGSTGNVVVTANWEATTETYTVTWLDYDQTSLGSEVYAYGATPRYKGETPSREATESATYEFAGWEPEIAPVTENVTYIAKYNEQSTVEPIEPQDYYVITFVDIKNALISEKRYAAGTPKEQIELPSEIQGYKLRFRPDLADVTADATYQALYDLQKFMITFVVDTVSKSQETFFGLTPKYNGTTDKASDNEFSYVFDGWEPAITPVTGDATYTAKFNAIPIADDPNIEKYRIVFVNENDTLQDKVIAKGVTPVFEGAEPTKAGNNDYIYQFTGWSPEIVPVADTATYVAKFDAVKVEGNESIEQYVITFKNGDEVLFTKSIAAGVVPTFVGDAPTQEADDENTYEFDGWDPEVVAVTKEATYAAKFKPIPIEVNPEVEKFRIYFVAGTDTLQNTEVAKGELPKYEGTPTKAPDNDYIYTFAGWQPEIVAVTKEATYSATFDPIVVANDTTIEKYRIVFVNENDTLQDKVIAKGVTPVFEGAEPTKAGDNDYIYRFAGWQPEIVPVADTATYVAQFDAVKVEDDKSIEQYVITFKNGDEVLFSKSIAAGVVPTFVGDAPTKEADDEYTYEFDGWDPEIVAVIAEATYTAKFKATPISVPEPTEKCSSEFDEHLVSSVWENWIFVINNKYIIEKYGSIDRSNVNWYRINGEQDGWCSGKVDDDELLVGGLYFAPEKAEDYVGEIYAVVVVNDTVNNDTKYLISDPINLETGAPLQLTPTAAKKNQTLHLTGLPFVNAVVRVYNVSGTLLQSINTEGNSAITFNAEDNDGVYIVKVSAGDYAKSVKYIVK